MDTTNVNFTSNTIEGKSDFEQRVEKYLRMSHQTLAEMLAMRDEDSNRDIQTPNQPNYPYSPLGPNTPWTIPGQVKWCPLSIGAVCTNQFGDCINCPYHNFGLYYTTTTCSTDNSDSSTNKDANVGKQFFDKFGEPRNQNKKKSDLN